LLFPSVEALDHSQNSESTCHKSRCGWGISNSYRLAFTCAFASLHRI
jgi:hypothetical protein